MTVASSEMARAGAAPPASVAARLRSFKLIPALSFTGLTVLAAVTVIATNANRLWLIGAVILGGSAILIFFSSKLAWRLLR